MRKELTKTEFKKMYMKYRTDGDGWSDEYGEHFYEHQKGGVKKNNGAGGRTRTDTLLPKRDFESRASTNFATPAELARRRLYICATGYASNSGDLSVVIYF